jgi:hypothetical protein
MRSRRQATIQELRRAIDCLPVATRTAMLDGIRSNEIIAGAYTNGGGVCPMLAAHRAGGRANFIGFARAWDRFAFNGSRVHVARRATDREVLILKSHLEASLLEEDGPAPDLAAAMAEHHALVARRERAEERRATERRAEERRAEERHAAETGPTRPGEPAARRAPRPTAPQPGTGRARPGEPDRTQELRGKPGWAWMRIFRRYDDYERALARVRAEHDALGEQRERELV